MLWMTFPCGCWVCRSTQESPTGAPAQVYSLHVCRYCLRAAEHSLRVWASEEKRTGKYTTGQLAIPFGRED